LKMLQANADEASSKESPARTNKMMHKLDLMVVRAGIKMSR
jgi:hypothetical protein